MTKTRVWAFIDNDLLGRLDEVRGSRSQGYVIERLIRAECDRPQDALTVDLSPDVLGVVKDMAIAQKRTVDAQAAWIVEEFCKQGKRNE
jgi:uncharacterized transporter YbjL